MELHKTQFSIEFDLRWKNVREWVPGWKNIKCHECTRITLWRHQMETFSAFLAICVGNSLVTGEFSSRRPVTRSFDVSFIYTFNKWLSRQSWGWWFETPSRLMWRHCNEFGQSILHRKNAKVPRCWRSSAPQIDCHQTSSPRIPFVWVVISTVIMERSHTMTQLVDKRYSSVEETINRATHNHT